MRNLPVVLGAALGAVLALHACSARSSQVDARDSSPIKSKPDRLKCALPGQDYNGLYDIQGVNAHMESAAACADLCHRTTRCNMAAYVASVERCYPKTVPFAQPETVPRAGVDLVLPHRSKLSCTDLQTPGAVPAPPPSPGTTPPAPTPPTPTLPAPPPSRELEAGDCDSAADCTSKDEPVCVIGGLPALRSSRNTVNMCLECGVDADCIGDNVCSESGWCEECRTSDDCATTGDRLMCSSARSTELARQEGTVRSVCLQCLGDFDCNGSANGPLCDMLNFRCSTQLGGCTDDAYCASAVGTFCAPGTLAETSPGKCTECRPGLDSDCAGKGSREVCDDLGDCRECDVGGRGCTDDKACDRFGMCAERCTSDADCVRRDGGFQADANTCRDDGTCVECKQTSDCNPPDPNEPPDFEGRLECVAREGRCIPRGSECFRDAQCGDGYLSESPRCRLGSGCVVCTSDDECSGYDVCINGACFGCRSRDDCKGSELGFCSFGECSECSYFYEYDEDGVPLESGCGPGEFCSYDYGQFTCQ